MIAPVLAHEGEVVRRQAGEADQLAFLVGEGEQLKTLRGCQNFATGHRFLPVWEARSMAFN